MKQRKSSSAAASAILIPPTPRLCFGRGFEHIFVWCFTADIWYLAEPQPDVAWDTFAMVLGTDRRQEQRYTADHLQPQKTA